MVICSLSDTRPWRQVLYSVAWKRRLGFWALLLTTVLSSTVSHVTTDHHCADRGAQLCVDVIQPPEHPPPACPLLEHHLPRSLGLCPQRDSHSPLCAASRECCEMPWPAALADGDKYRSPVATVCRTQVSEVQCPWSSGKCRHVCVQTLNSRCFHSSRSDLDTYWCRICHL